MSGLLDGLSKLGLGGLESEELFSKPEEKQVKKKAPAAAPKINEADLIYDKSFTCPVCDQPFTAKIMKTGRGRLLSTDRDLKPNYEGIEAQKYDVICCPHCGYAALQRFYTGLTSKQVHMIKEKICDRVKLPEFGLDIYSYDDAKVRYQLALACAIVKHGRNSERAYICLKDAWLLRGEREELAAMPEADPAKLRELAETEHSQLANAYKGFLEARQNETPPLAGMDEMTVDYLLAALGTEMGDYDTAGRLVSAILTSASASSRIKDKARTLKEEIVAAKKKA